METASPVLEHIHAVQHALDAAALLRAARRGETVGLVVPCRLTWIDEVPVEPAAVPIQVLATTGKTEVCQRITRDPEEREGSLGL